MREVRVAYDRCKKLYTRYYMLHRKASVACTAAGVTPPALWAPRSGASAPKMGDRMLSPTPEVSTSSYEPETPVLQSNGSPSPATSTIDPRGVPIPSLSEESPDAAASAHERLLATETNFGSPSSLPGSLISPDVGAAGNGAAVSGGAVYDADARASRTSRGSLGSADDRSRTKLVDVDALHERVGSSKHESPSVEPAFPIVPNRTSAGECAICMYAAAHHNSSCNAVSLLSSYHFAAQSLMRSCAHRLQSRASASQAAGVHIASHRPWHRLVQSD